MSGIFGVVSEEDCVDEVFYGTDYHSHLGTKIGGMAIFDGKSIQYEIKSIGDHPFRSQLFNFKKNINGNMGIGVISDYEPQPLSFSSRLGNYAIVHVGKVNNLEQLVKEAHKRKKNFVTNSKGIINFTEVVASLINQGEDYVDGIEIMQNKVKGSSSVMLLTKDGIYLARDKFGRTPIITGKKNGAIAATLETCAFPNLGFKIDKYLGPGEIGLLTPQGYEQLKTPGDTLQLCPFLYIYFGFPASHYEDINVEVTRYKLGKLLAQRDKKEGLKIDFISGIPDSGIGSAIGYMNESRIPYKRPYTKYNPTWARSFMPQSQTDRKLIAEYKLIPIKELIDGSSILFTDDSIVRGTQLIEKIKELFSYGAKEVHMRPSCPPLTYSCDFLNFSRSKSVFDLAARKAIRKVEGKEEFEMEPYLDEDSDKYKRMVHVIRGDIGLTSLKYPKFDDMISTIGLPKEKLCLGCWRECKDGEHKSN